MDLQLRGKRVLVQGSSSGLGFAIAKTYAEEGAKVAICSRDQKRIEEAARKIPGSIPLIADLSHKGDGARIVREVVQQWGGIDILITNSGGPTKGVFLKISVEDWEKGFRDLWLGALESIHEALPHMQKQKWGRILLSTSTAAKEPIFSLTISNALRSGLLGLMKTLSMEIARDSITVNALLPGYTKTNRLAELGSSETELTQTIPIGRLGKPEEYAALAAFLGSEKAAYITGQAIACDGGLIRGL